MELFGIAQEEVQRTMELVESLLHLIGLVKGAVLRFGEILREILGYLEDGRIQIQEKVISYLFSQFLDSLNDLWKFDGKLWTWMGGDQQGNVTNVYVAVGVSSALNLPGSRHRMSWWTDSNGYVYIFGGTVKNATNSVLQENDLWRFDYQSWTCLNPGQSSELNKDNSGYPRKRILAATWYDSDSNVAWFFGGDASEGG